MLLNRLPLNSTSEASAGSYSEAYGGVSIDRTTGLVFAVTGSQPSVGDFMALAPASPPLPAY